MAQEGPRTEPDRRLGTAAKALCSPTHFSLKITNNHLALTASSLRKFLFVSNQAKTPPPLPDPRHIRLVFLDLFLRWQRTKDDVVLIRLMINLILLKTPNEVAK